MIARLSRFHFTTVATTTPKEITSPIIIKKKTKPFSFWFETKLPSGYWEDFNNQTAFIQRVAKQLNITDYNQWYGVNFKKEIGGT